MQTAAGAAKAYASLARLGTGAGTDPAKALGKVGGDQSFGNMVKDALGQVAQSARGADGQAQAMAAGKANVVDVVTAVAESEVAVDALVAVRDRVIAAYEEIMRMPI
jgi:flagellar hook-basal body complex protein FliE